jgi:PhnB protein
MLTQFPRSRRATTTTLNPYLNFRGNTRDAMQFYQSIFGGTLNVSTFADFQASSDPSEDNLVMHSMLEAPGGIVLMAADVPSRMEYHPGNNFSLSLSGDDEPELRGYFEQLAAGGSVSMPLNQAPWGDTFGMCSDRFGVNWLVNITGENTSAST